MKIDELEKYILLYENLYSGKKLGHREISELVTIEPDVERLAKSYFFRREMSSYYSKKTNEKSEPLEIPGNIDKVEKIQAERRESSDITKEEYKKLIPPIYLWEPVTEQDFIRYATAKPEVAESAMYDHSKELVEDLYLQKRKRDGSQSVFEDNIRIIAESKKYFGRGSIYSQQENYEMSKIRQGSVIPPVN